MDVDEDVGKKQVIYKYCDKHVKLSHKSWC
jgi:hypothetical protein